MCKLPLQRHGIGYKRKPKGSFALNIDHTGRRKHTLVGSGDSESLWVIKLPKD